MDFLYSIDLSVFYFFNHTVANSILDILMPFITKASHWIPIYVIWMIALLYLGFKQKKKIYIIAVCCFIIGVIISDQTSSRFLKNLINRDRPCVALSDVRNVVPCAGGKSFPSAHAVNNFTAAFLAAFFFRKYAKLFFSIAGIIAFSRVYIGVHYPSDIIGGTIIGLLLGWLIVKLASFLLLKAFKIDLLELTSKSAKPNFR